MFQKFNDFQDGAYTLYVKNTSIKNLTLQAQYLDEDGVTNATDKMHSIFKLIMR